MLNSLSTPQVTRGFLRGMIQAPGGGEIDMLLIIVTAILLANLLFLVYVFVKHMKLKRDFERRRREIHKRWTDVKENKSEK